MVFTWYRELGLAIEKHNTTTSDLKLKYNTRGLNSGTTHTVGAKHQSANDEANLPAVRKTTVLMVVSKSVPEPKGHADVVHYISGAL